MLTTRSLANSRAALAKPLAILAALVAANACGDAARHGLTDPATPTIAPAASRALACNEQSVSRRGTTITVIPTGSDDTPNIQCAIDGTQSGGVVQLEAGVYRTAQIMASNFRGALRGRGATQTIVQNLPNLVVTVEDLFTQRPDAAHTWPALFAFWDGDVVLSDLTIKIVGDCKPECPTTGWSIYGLNPHEMALAVVMLGHTANIQVSDVVIDAQRTAPEATVLGTNLLNGIFVEAAFGGNPDALTGSFTVTRSKFNNVGDPVPIRAVDGFQAEFTHNLFVDPVEISAGDLKNATVRYADNTVTSALAPYSLGFHSFDVGLFPYGVQNTRLIYEGNTLAGEWGAYEEATFGPNVNCLFVNNNTAGTVNGLYLGANPPVCRMIGKNTQPTQSPAAQVMAPRAHRELFPVLESFLRLHNGAAWQAQARASTSIARATSTNGGAPMPVTSDDVVSGLCPFDIRLQTSGLAKMLVVGKTQSIMLFTSPALTATLTNVSTQKQVALTITGAFHVTADASGNAVYVVTGRNLLFDPVAGFVLTEGDFSYTLGSDGVTVVHPLTGTGRTTEVCALLS